MKKKNLNAPYKAAEELLKAGVRLVNCEHTLVHFYALLLQGRQYDLLTLSPAVNIIYI